MRSVDSMAPPRFSAADSVTDDAARTQKGQYTFSSAGSGSRSVAELKWSSSYPSARALGQAEYKTPEGVNYGSAAFRICVGFFGNQPSAFWAHCAL